MFEKYNLILNNKLHHNRVINLIIYQAACWSCDGKMLLFAMEADPVLYCIKFGTLQHDFMLKDDTTAQVKSGSMGSAPMAVAVADLSDVILTSQSGEDVR